MDNFMLGLAGLLLMAIWSFFLKKSILDDHRDRLFDLRDHVRDIYDRNNWDMGSPEYKKIRDQINAFLFFTSDFSLSDFLICEFRHRKNPIFLARVARSRNDRLLKQGSPEFDFLSACHARALYITMSYMVMSSGFLMCMLLISAPVILVCEAAKSCWKTARERGFAVFKQAVELHQLVVLMNSILVDRTATVLKFNSRFIEAQSIKHAKIRDAFI